MLTSATATCKRARALGYPSRFAYSALIYRVQRDAPDTYDNGRTCRNVRAILRVHSRRLAIVFSTGGACPNELEFCSGFRCILQAGDGDNGDN